MGKVPYFEEEEGPKRRGVLVQVIPTGHQGGPKTTKKKQGRFNNLSFTAGKLFMGKMTRETLYKELES